MPDFTPVELYRSVRFVGDENGIRAMATDGVETVSVAVDAFTESEIDFCVSFKELKDLIRMGRSETIELTGKFIEFPAFEEPDADAVSAILPVNFGELLTQAAPIVDRTGYRRVLHGINLSHAGVTVTDGKWKVLYGTNPPGYGPVFMRRRLAYRIQELFYGGLPEHVKAEMLSKKQTSARKSGILKPGNHLIREWHDKKYEIIIRPNGVEYNGHLYRSLTAVASKITGTHRNGKKFFGVE